MDADNRAPGGARAGCALRPRRRRPLRHNLRLHQEPFAGPIRTRRCSGWPRCCGRGEAPAFIARRLVILASEDIGNADPRALTLAGRRRCRRGARGIAGRPLRAGAGDDISRRRAQKQRRGARPWNGRGGRPSPRERTWKSRAHLRNTPPRGPHGDGHRISIPARLPRTIMSSSRMCRLRCGNTASTTGAARGQEVGSLATATAAPARR